MFNHPDEGVREAVGQLLEALSSWERNTGRRIFLALVPERLDEPVFIADSGAPVHMEDSEKMRLVAIGAHVEGRKNLSLTTYD